MVNNINPDQTSGFVLQCSTDLPVCPNNKGNFGSFNRKHRQAFQRENLLSDMFRNGIVSRMLIVNNKLY